MRCQVMGIVNVTPDSFSDGGRYFTPEEAVKRSLNLIAEGADILDLGAESTRPGATPIGWEEEWSRLEPVLGRVVGAAEKSRAPVRVSVDTYHPETAVRAVRAGATLINCVKGEGVPAMLDICAESSAELVFPYRLAGSVPTGTGAFPAKVGHYLDPMIGFDTTREDDLALLRSLPELAKLGRVVVGVSRKRIVKKLTGEKVTGKNLGGNLALAVWCAQHGASVLRVHDVGETVQALKVLEALG